MRTVTTYKAAVAAITTLTLAAGFAGSAYASSDDGAYRRAGQITASAEPGAGSAVLPIEDVLARLRTAGYTAIHGVERKHDGYEVKGRNAQGRAVELHVDGRTGEVQKEERDD